MQVPHLRLLKMRNNLCSLYLKDPHVRTSWIHLGNTAVILISLLPWNWMASLTSSNAEKTCQSLTLGVFVGEAVSVCEAPVHRQRLSGRRKAAPLHPSTPKQVGRVGSVPRASRKQSVTVGETNFLSTSNKRASLTYRMLKDIHYCQKSPSSPSSLNRTWLNSWQFLLFTPGAGQCIASLFLCLIYCRKSKLLLVFPFRTRMIMEKRPY